MKQNVGLDTETYKGKVLLICDSYGRYREIDSMDSILDFLTSSKYLKTFNWFFNLKYDFESIIKWLSKEELIALYNNRQIEYGKYKIRYLDKKYFSIRLNQSSYIFYDINNFIETSLNKASKIYLGDAKLDIIDSKRLNEDINYWKENKKEIIEYCLKDALLTKQVADKFWSIMYDTLKFYPYKPYSKGRFSEEYFCAKCFMPTVNKINTKILEYGYNSYYGGRFEILKRGYFDTVYMYDIKSAYPYQMQDLLDINKGRWKKVFDYDEKADYGFYKCKITVFHPIISPCMQRIRGLNVYPNGEFIQFLTQEEIEFILSTYNNIEIEVIDGYCFYATAYFYPLKEEIQKLYELKESAPDKQTKLMYKIVLNSLYGKFIQTAGGKTGKLFNPIWASIITANTRIQLLKYALKNPESIIGFSTDCIHSQIPMNFKQDGSLGSFELSFKGKGIFLMSDIYTVWNDTADKSRFRGFNKKDDEKEITKIGEHTVDLKYDLRVILEYLGDKKVYEYKIERPIHLGEALKQVKKLTVDDINIFTTITKKLNINGDKKRLWKRDFIDGFDAMENSIESEPIVLLE